MPEFPASPIPPAKFMEKFLPEAFAEADLPESGRKVDVRLGVVLEGQGGGEWVLHIEAGELRVVAEPRDETAFSVVQTVDDWRGALWEGRGGAIGQQAATLFRPGVERAGSAGGSPGAPTPAGLQALQALQGLIRMVVIGGKGGDWRVDFKLGPGDLPAEPTTTLTVSADDSDAMARGELNPIEAFMAGRIQVAGDMALVMQVQAAQMQAAAGGGSGS